jgi:hypothetical protein
MVQAFGFQFSQTITRRFQVLGKMLRKTQIKSSMFHVDHYAFKLGFCQFLSYFVCLLLGRFFPNGYIPCSFGLNTQDRHDIRVQ